MKPLKIILISLLINFSLQAQEEKYIRKAKIATDRAEYAKAINYYKEALEIKKNSFEANTGMGVVLGEFMERYEEAIPFLEKALIETSSDTITTIYYTLGKCYHFKGDYNKALFFYKKLEDYKEIGNPLFSILLQKRIADCNYGLQHMAVHPDQSITNLGPIINTSAPEYVPLLTGNNELIFTSKRKDKPKEKINGWDGKYFESMYISKMENGTFSEPRRFTEPDLSENSKFSKFNESNVSLSPNGDVIFIYKNGDLYEASLKKRESEAKKLNKNINFARYQNHAALSRDQKVLFFSSEAKDGIGGTDIYTSIKNDGGEWSKAVILDTSINTIFNEDAPYVSEDGTLYFSSNGHPGYGGYDVYKTHMENGKWTRPENLGQPINSPGQDIYFILTEKDKGYYSSARAGGYGDLDLYAVNLNINIKKDTITEPLAFENPPDKIQQSPTIQDSSISTQYLSERELKNLKWNSSPLYFNYSSFTLRNDAKLILRNNLEVLQKNPELIIVINGYSDARGQEKFNKYLSANRANSVKKYLIQEGIEIARIKSVEGLGESGLLNDCSDGIQCSEEQHQQNRRVEIKIINPDHKLINPVVTGQK
jgi:outer membrane protein OmpA-like peptidoglycan-associated protein